MRANGGKKKAEKIIMINIRLRLDLTCERAEQRRFPKQEPTIRPNLQIQSERSDEWCPRLCQVSGYAESMQTFTNLTAVTFQSADINLDAART